MKKKTESGNKYQPATAAEIFGRSQNNFRCDKAHTSNPTHCQWLQNPFVSISVPSKQSVRKKKYRSWWTTKKSASLQS